MDFESIRVSSWVATLGSVLVYSKRFGDVFDKQFSIDYGFQTEKIVKYI